jgi:hypothetical protein
LAGMPSHGQKETVRFQNSIGEKRTLASERHSTAPDPRQPFSRFSQFVQRGHSIRVVGVAAMRGKVNPRLRRVAMVLCLGKPLLAAEMKTREQWDALCGIVADQMKVFTRPFVTPIVHEALGQKARIGSGTYIDFSHSGVGDTTLLTCEHVARYQPQQHRPNGSGQLISLSGVACTDRDPIDAATVRVSSLTWAERAHEAKPLPIRKFAPKHNPVEDEILFFRGLAGENAYVGFGGFDAIITGYCSQEKRETGNSQIFEIFWEPDKTQITSNTNSTAREKVKYDNGEGFSGSLVWNTRFVETGCDINVWNPCEAVVTGLLRRWDTTNQTLLVWRIEHLTAWLAARPVWA